MIVSLAGDKFCPDKSCQAFIKKCLLLQLVIVIREKMPDVFTDAGRKKNSDISVTKRKTIKAIRIILTASPNCYKTDKRGNI